MDSLQGQGQQEVRVASKEEMSWARSGFVVSSLGASVLWEEHTHRFPSLLPVSHSVANSYGGPPNVGLVLTSQV